MLNKQDEPRQNINLLTSSCGASGGMLRMPGSSEIGMNTERSNDAEINKEAGLYIHSNTSRPFNKPKSGRIAVKVINYLGDEAMKVYAV